MSNFLDVNVICSCDCKPGYLHYPKNGICYEAYTQGDLILKIESSFIFIFKLFSGPCQDFEIVVLTNASNIPLCIENRCEAGKVFFEDGCYPLNSEEGCLKFNKFIGRNVFLVPNPTTLELTCADEDFKYACVDNCCIGSKREYREVCRNRSKPKKSSGKV